MLAWLQPLPWTRLSVARQWAAVVLAWTGVTVTAFARVSLAATQRGDRWQGLEGFATWWMCYGAWAAVTPLLARMVLRFPLHGRGWRLRLAPYVMAGPLLVYIVAFVRAAGVRILFAAGWLADSEPFGPWWRFSPLQFFLELLICAGAIAVLEALVRRHQERRRDQELADLNVRRLQLENDLRDAQLQALRMKLNPHFLFNALQSISTLMRADGDAAERMMARLGDVLRMALRHDLDSEVTVREEIDLARAYLDLERIRFGDRLLVQIDVPADLQDAAVPSLLLQPLLENAIRHGVNRLSGTALLSIRVERRGDELIVSVVDNGTGFATAAGGATKRGIGLGLLEPRLAKLYGAAANCRFGNRAEGGAWVEVRLPCRMAQAKERPA